MKSPDWNTINPMSNEAERLWKIEGQVVTLEANDKDKEIRIRSIEKTIWMAFGASALFQLFLFAVIEYGHK